MEVIELMPPAVKTDMTVALSASGGVTLIEADELVKLSLKALAAGASEVRPGQANALAFMRRLAPDFINRQLWKSARKLVPAREDAQLSSQPRAAALSRART